MRVITSATETPAVAGVLRYWREVVSCLPRDDPLRPGYEKLAFVHPESILSSFLSGSPIEERSQDITPIFPFRCNLSQRAAVEKALTSSISVIEGPPGTGKTETILNLIANIVAVQHMTVGIVSFGNAAVDNVRDKLNKLGFGHVIGSLGRREKREEFFAAQAAATLRSRNSWSTRRTGRTLSGSCCTTSLPVARYAHLTVSPQVMLRNLLPDLGRLTPAQRAYTTSSVS